MRNSKGFTLIELLVVISIISLLSSIVFTTLNGAKAKAKDAAIKTEMGEITKLMDMEYNDNGSYCKLQNALWISYDQDSNGNPYSCDSIFANINPPSNYLDQFKAICKNVLNNVSNTSVYTSNHQLYLGTAQPTYPCGNYYSFMAPLSNGKYYCVGSSGRKSESSEMHDPGCYDSP